VNGTSLDALAFGGYGDGRPFDPTRAGLPESAAILGRDVPLMSSGVNRHLRPRHHHAQIHHRQHHRVSVSREGWRVTPSAGAKRGLGVTGRTTPVAFLRRWPHHYMVHVIDPLGWIEHE